MEVYRRQEKYSLRKEVQGKGGILSVLKVILVDDSFPASDIIPYMMLLINKPEMSNAITAS